jgi:4-amino-4-deoxy-L-arabinose transferase-like glycosyltransferase
VAGQRDLPNTDPVEKLSPKGKQPAHDESGESLSPAAPSLQSTPGSITLQSFLHRAPVLWLLAGFSLLVLNIPLDYSLDRIEPSTTLWLYRAGGTLSLLLGALAFLIGAYTVGSGESFGPWDRIQRWISSRLGISEVQIPLVAGSVGFALLGSAGAGDKPLMFQPAVALVAWGIGIVLAVAGFWSAPSKGRNIRSAAAWALLFFLAALLIRLPDLSLPPLSGDEGSTGADALLFLRGYANTFFRPAGWHSFPGLYFYLISLSVQLLGRTVLALRLTSAAAGALTVGVLYLAARALFGHRTAVIAAVLLAVSPFHIFSSHLGLNNVWDALGFAALAGALWYGWKNGSRNAFLLAGLALGLSQYFYSTTQLMVFLVLGWMIAAFFLDRPRFKNTSDGWVRLWMTAVITVLPIVFFLIARPSDFGGHTLSRSLLKPGWIPYALQLSGGRIWVVAGSQLFKAFGVFTFVPALNWYQPWGPLLRPVEAAFFLAGLIFLALTPRDLRTWLIFGWIGIFGIIGALSIDVPTSQRYIGSAPACALLVAVALVEIWTRLAEWIPSARRWAAIASVAVILFIAADNLNFIFADYFPNTVFRGKYDFEGLGGIVANQIVELLQERRAHYAVVYLPGIVVESRPEQFLIPDYEEVKFTQPFGSPENPKLAASHLLFILPPGKEDELHQVMAVYPGGMVGQTFTWDGLLVFYYYDVVLPVGMGTGYAADTPAIPRRDACEGGPVRWCFPGPFPPSQGSKTDE